MCYCVKTDKTKHWWSRSKELEVLMKCTEGRLATSLHSTFLDLSHFLIFMKLHDLNKIAQCQSGFLLLK